MADLRGEGKNASDISFPPLRTLRELRIFFYRNENEININFQDQIRRIEIRCMGKWKTVVSYGRKICRNVEGSLWIFLATRKERERERDRGFE